MGTYEKKYKEALERARDFKNNIVHKELTVGESIMDYIFPELKESEDEKTIKEIVEYLKKNLRLEWATWLEKQGEQKSQRMISAEAKEAMYDKPANTVEPKCEESKIKIFDAPTPFEDKLYAFVLACEILVDPSKREFILEHSQEILDAAREQIGKEQSSTWSKEDDVMIYKLLAVVELYYDRDGDDLDKQSCIDWLKALKQRCAWKPSDEQLEALKNAIHIKPFKNPSDSILWRLYEQLKKLKS